MNILVTGGAGFIGTNFLLRFVPRHPEHRFVNLDVLSYAANPQSLTPLEEAPNYVFERGDIAEPDDVQAVFARHRPDVVVHLAAESHVDRSIAGPEAFVRTNVHGTFVLLEACRQHWSGDGHVFLHVSTDEVYGSVAPPGRFREDSPYAPSSPYSASKAAADHLVSAWGATYGLPVRITHSGNNFGPHQFPEKLIPLMVLNACAGRALPIYGTGTNVRDWLYVDDHCDALWAVLERGENGQTYNIGASSERSNVEVVDAICAAIASETRRELADLRALKTFVADRPAHDARYAIDASKLTERLGWSPRHSFESGLRDTVRWYLRHPDWVAAVQTGAYREWIARNYGSR